MRRRLIIEACAGETFHRPWVLKRKRSSPSGSLSWAESSAMRGQQSSGSESNLIFSSLERRFPEAIQAACAFLPGGRSESEAGVSEDALGADEATPAARAPTV